jgi:N-acetylglucosamine-6-phosphate deacetylase
MSSVPTPSRLTIDGRLVLADRVEGGRLTVEDGWIVAVEAIDIAPDAPFVAPGFVDIHVHGGGGHEAMGDAAALDGMARYLLRHGVTAFLPTVVSAPLLRLGAFASGVRAWIPHAPADGAEPLGFNLEGPFLADARRGAHDPTSLAVPAEVPRADLEPLLDGLRVVTVAPELPGAIELIAWFRERGVTVSLGHSAAGVDEAMVGYAAGAASTTHLFNAMRGVDHREPGLAVAALTDDTVAVELIADGIHVHPALWPMITGLKPAGRLILVSDAIALAGTGEGCGRLGGLEVEVVGSRATLAGTATLAGSVIGLDDAIRNLVGSGVPLPAAAAAASRNPLDLLGVTDRGRLGAGQRADLVELDPDLRVRRVMRAGVWFVGIGR